MHSEDLRMDGWIDGHLTGVCMVFGKARRKVGVDGRLGPSPCYVRDITSTPLM